MDQGQAGRDVANHISVHIPQVAIRDELTQELLGIVDLPAPELVYCEEFNKAWLGRGRYAEPHYPES